MRRVEESIIMLGGIKVKIINKLTNIKIPVSRFLTQNALLVSHYRRM